MQRNADGSVNFVETLREIEDAGVDANSILEAFGLRFRAVGNPSNRAWLGMRTRTEEGQLLVSQVRRGTPAYDAGLNVGDEILAIDEDTLARWLKDPEALIPGQRMNFRINDNGQIRDIVAFLRQESVRRQESAAPPTPAWRR